MTECNHVQLIKPAHDHKCNEWKNILKRYPKLLTYMTVKDSFCIEPYVSMCMNRK